MRMTTIVLIATALHVTAKTHAQQVTLTSKHIELGDVFNALMKQTGYSFLCAQKLLEQTPPLELNIHHASLQEALDDCLAGLPLTYEIKKKERVVFIKEKKVRAASGVAPPVADTMIALQGRVVNQDGDPVPGASIRIKNTNLGTTTDDAGHFALPAVEEDAVLIVTSLGYTLQEQPVVGTAPLEVTLVPAATGLNQLVVVGYGTQKKKDLTGAVTTIDFEKQAEGRPLMNVSSGLSGLAPGLQAFQSSGDPGEDGAGLHIRGFGTLNSSSPLVLIDGFEGSMDDVNPVDVKSITILRDAASASIYGSRAANGVILVTTKTGTEGKARFTYNGYVTFQNTVNSLPFVSNYARHMQYINMAKENIGLAPQFSQASIDEAIAKAEHPMDTNSYGIPNYMAYPNTDWFDVLFNTGVSQSHNLAASGGSDKFKYRFSLGYLKNVGVIADAGIERLQYRANIEAKPLSWLTVKTSIDGRRQDEGLGNVSRAFEYLYRTTPGVYPGTRDKYGQAYLTVEEASTANNILQFLNDKEGKDIRTRMALSLGATIDFTDKLSFESRYYFRPKRRDYDYHSVRGQTWDYQLDRPISARVLSNTTIYNESTKSVNFVTDQILRYHTQFGQDHHLNVLLGYNETYSESSNLSASTMEMLDWSVITLGSGTVMKDMNGNENGWRMRSLYGRVNYNFKDKYLLEGNLRYDGSSRFSPYDRWGLFPSVSAGWRISEEPFFAAMQPYVPNLKIRASWGQLGNAASGNYDWQEFYSARSLVMDGVPDIGLAIGKQGNSYLHWESTTIEDIGLDIGLLKNRLNLSIDLYNKQTSGILYTRQLNLTAGLVQPATENIAGVNNKGFEVALSMDDHIGKFSYHVSGNFAYNRNRVTKYKGTFIKEWQVDKDGNKVYVNNQGEATQNGFGGLITEGHTLGEHYVREVYNGNGSYSGEGVPSPDAGPKDGMIRTENDLKWVQAMMDAGHRFAPLNVVAKDQIWYGDLIYADINGDGIYGDNNDMKLTGTSSLPKMNFGLNLSASYGSFDVSMVWFGAAGFALHYNAAGYNSSNIHNGWGIPKEYAKHAYYWDPEHPDNPFNNQNGSMPRLTFETGGNSGASSTFWEYNGSFLKLRNLQLGYTIPQRITKRALVQNFRLYLSAENLLTITDFPGLDPEMGSSVHYPIFKQYAIGVNLSF